MGNIRYFDWEQRKQILSGELVYDPDSHTSINVFYGYKGVAEDCRNKYEYNPLSGEFTVDKINSLDDSKEVEAKVRALDFKTICEPLIIKPIVNPFKVKNDGLEDRHIELLKEWGRVYNSVRDLIEASIEDSVKESVWSLVWGYVEASIEDSIEGLVWDSVKESVWGSVWSYVEASIEDPVWDSVWDSVLASTWGYISSFFNLEKWGENDHELYKNPFQSAIDLWEEGFVPSFDGKVWRLHSGENAEIVYEISEDELVAE